MNTHYNPASKLAEVQSLWIDTSYTEFPIVFTLSFAVGSSATTSSLTYVNDGTFTSQLNSNLMNFASTAGYPITSISTPSTRTGTSWVEYKITFTYDAVKNPPPLILLLQSPKPTRIAALVNTLTDMNAFPLFQSSTFSAKTYTCYKREHNYFPFTYATGNGNAGVTGAVNSVLYSIGYSVLHDGIKNHI